MHCLWSGEQSTFSTSIVPPDLQPRSMLPFTPDGPVRGENRAKMLPLDPLSKLREVSQKTGRLLVTWTTGGDFAKMALNLAMSIRRNVPWLEHSFAVICLDRDADQQLRAEQFTTVLLPGPADENAVKDPWQNDDLWKFKYRLMASLMTLGLAALVLDTDVVLVSDPFQHLTGDADLEVMTDLFFPDMHLLNVSIRPEDHINTGYVYHTATPSALRFMLAFLDAFDAHEWRGFKRDWFNQRAFNKLVLEWVDAGSVKVLYGPGAWCALRGSRTNVGTVARSRQRSCVERTPTSGVTIRVLNPAVIAHGMNFFWRRAHLMRSETGGLPLAAVHANGVEPKDYFLRDRGLWYLDDFTERFGEAPRFFTYVHPRGLSLAEDFEEVAAALEVAMMLQRRLVLPMTMNCRNCPAYGPYGFAEWADKKDLGCTFDYFSRASLAMGEWLKFTVESGVVWLPEFQELLKARRHVSAASLQTELRSAGGRRPAELFGDTAVVQLGEALRVHVLRDLLKQAVRGQPLDSLPCAWRAWPATTFACRDAVLPQVGEEHSGGRDLRASCDGSMQGECGLLPFMCCEAYFGWAEKLEVLGGKTWDLPCGCGLGRHCAQTSRTSDMQVCCEPRVVGARKKFGENCGHNPPVEALPDLVPDDADTYSSSILRELAKGNLAREDAERLCLSFAALHKALGGQEAWRFCQDLLERFLGAQDGFATPQQRPAKRGQKRTL
ncbi:unnamed protein product [Durusdinium trenchii]|uniref:Nucleotide-diphospho-sugar transferase domain-containing protein n=1 Tax=Durusdinium trenchii TaxID=1381693 RepID=A0ABP0NZP8_9DINO